MKKSNEQNNARRKMSKKNKKIQHLSFPFGKDALKLPIPKSVIIGKTVPVSSGSTMRFTRYQEKEEHPS